MGSVNLDNTGSGSAITLSSDGTSLLLDGTAIGGGGGGGSSPDLFDENYDGTSTKPSATGTNAITTGRQATATGTDAFGHGVNADASGQYSVSFGVNSEATGQSAMAMGRDSVATGNLSFAGPNSRANSDYSTAFSITNNGTSYGAGGARSIAIGKQAKTDSATWDNVAIGKNAISNVSGGVSIAGAGLPVKISDVYSLPTADGSANQVMTTDGSGTVSWATPSGGGGSSPDLFAENYDGTSTAPSATGTNAVAIGVGASATTTGSFAVLGSASNGEYGIVMGINSTGVGNMPVAIGSSASARTRTISIGQSTTSNGTGSVAIGANVFADPSSGDGAVGLGNWAYAKGASSFANSFSRAGGASSIALGITSQSSTYGASGANSIAIGKLAKATTEKSIGIIAQATGNYAVAIGDGTVASGSASLALGRTNDASATYSTAIGSNCSIAGFKSVGIGRENTINSSHESSLVLGEGIQSTASNQVSIGGTTQDVRISEVYTLPKVDGTASGQVLTTDGSGTVSWATPAGGGAYEFIASTGAITSSTSSVVFDSSHFDSSSYRNYVFKFANVKIQSDSWYLQLHVSYDDGSSYETGNIYQDGSSLRNFSLLTLNGLGTDTNESGVSGDMLLYNPHETSAYTYFQTHFAYMTSSGSLVRENGVREQLHLIKNTSAINNIKITVGSGNFASGYIDMYGIKKA